MKTFEEVIEFHGHACPGLALGYRVSLAVLKEFGKRASDEELVAVVENNSCAVDAVQVMTGCTFGKGNLIFKDYGKQAYSFIKRPSGKGIRISVIWTAPRETDNEKNMWKKYIKGDRSEKVLTSVHNRKAKKIENIMLANDRELFRVAKGKTAIPEGAYIYASLKCALCGEKVMEPRARVRDGRIVCIPCAEEMSGKGNLS
jgi:formylmethanofuran dehydrogenase subunit E